MASVALTKHLHRFFPSLAPSAPIEIQAASVAELIGALDARFPGLAGYLCDESGSLRPHVNVFVNGRPIRDRLGLTDALDAASAVHVMQALSGG